MKKQSLFTILITILLSMVEAKAFAYDIAVENAEGVTIYYNYINDGRDLEVTYKDEEYHSYGGQIVIPGNVTFMNRSRKVTAIGDNAFNDCSYITISLPNSLTSIGNYAFKYCFFTSITIPNSVTSIGTYAFEGCFSLTSVTIPNNVTSLGGAAFKGCYDLETVVIGDGVTSIGSQTFKDCEKLQSVTIGKSVNYIGSSAFENCNALSYVNILDLAAWCKIEFKTIKSSFGNPLSIAKRLYLNGTEIQDLIIPESVTSISDYAFVNCKYIKSVKFPEHMVSIGSHAFMECDGLTFVNIPNDVTKIGSDAFVYCSGLSSVVIGKKVTSIGQYAFAHVDIPTIVSKIEEPSPIYKSSFTENTFKNATLYVPKGTIDKYKSTEGWQDFLFIEEGTGPNGGGETPKPLKCAKPTILYQNCIITFNCDTEGATCQ